MKRRGWLLILIIGFGINLAFTQERPRVLVLTDIENEPDDAQSLVRFLLYSSHFDIEGLVATTSTHLRNRTAAEKISEIVSAYGQVRSNLLKHESGYPSEPYLQSRIKSGLPLYGMEGVGEGKDSEGSEWLISMVDKADKRPLWVPIWGGANVLAQALWKVQQTRDSNQLSVFVSKLRAYAISDQDDSAIWIRNTFPDLFYIVSPGENYIFSTWTGIAGETHRNYAIGADTSLVGNPWLREHIIEDHGPLGAVYPEVAYIMEGDSPSFMNLINNGLSNPDHPEWGGWGGRYELYQPRFIPYRNFDTHQPETRPIWTDAQDEVIGKDGRKYINNQATIWRWRDAYQHDFAARMDWCLQSYEQANHPPVVEPMSPDNLILHPGDELFIDASDSSDPDQDELSFRWFVYTEAGTFWRWSWKKPLLLEGQNTSKLSLELNKNIGLNHPQTLHLILEVTDNGSPSLTRYGRYIVNLMPSVE